VDRLKVGRLKVGGLKVGRLKVGRLKVFRKNHEGSSDTVAFMVFPSA